MDKGDEIVDRSMTTNQGSGEIRRRETASRLAIRLLRDETAVTTLEYVVAAVALALAGVAASRVIASVLKNYLHRIYLVVTLPIP
jgi:Flp pilus assembly pilin Flp